MPPPTRYVYIPLCASMYLSYTRICHIHPGTSKAKRHCPSPQGIETENFTALLPWVSLDQYYEVHYVICTHLWDLAVNLICTCTAGIVYRQVLVPFQHASNWAANPPRASTPFLTSKESWWIQGGHPICTESCEKDRSSYEWWQLSIPGIVHASLWKTSPTCSATVHTSDVHKPRFRALLPLNTTFDTHIARMTEPGTWGTRLEIQAAATLFSSPVYVASQNPTTHQFYWKCYTPYPPVVWQQ